MHWELVINQLKDLERSATDPQSRLSRTQLDPADFQSVAETGFLLAGVPQSHGGLWSNLQTSIRPLCEMVLSLARWDPSLALVSCMHPGVLGFWLSKKEAPEPFTKAWKAQREAVFETVRQGHWWGTITSEPGSGGDLFKTKSAAKPAEADHAYRLSGDKHFGSGSGVLSFMITTAIPEGEELPDLFFMDTRNVPWDGSTGMKILREWDGFGMMATQSHAFQFQEFPVTRVAWPASPMEFVPFINQLTSCLFTAVIAGVVETALEEARKKLAPKREQLRPYEQVEWTRTVNECWTIQQVYEGMLQSIEHSKNPMTVGRGKMVIAELAETVLTRIPRILGGGTFSKSAPFGQWGQDVRALGFLRPPWGLAFDNLYEQSWED